MATPGDLVASTPEYATIGDFYGEIRSALLDFASCHPFLESSCEAQLDPASVALPGLIVIHELRAALAALETIVERGEGSSAAKDDCHFTRFQAMRREWAALETANPGFIPFHPAAHDPVMRRPTEGMPRVWITANRAARLLDIGNAIYGFMLTLLDQAFAPAMATSRRSGLTEAAMILMRVLAGVGRALVRLPASGEDCIHAGLTFAVPRNLRGGSAPFLQSLLRERLLELKLGSEPLGMATIGAGIRQGIVRYRRKARA